MRPSSRAWLALGAGVAAYDVLAPKGETLSERLDTELEANRLRRTLALGAIAITALHLSNVLPERADPFHYALRWKDIDAQA